MEKVITYIDGFNLYFGMREKYNKKYLWLDLDALTTNLLKPHQKSVHIHYFTATINNTNNKGKRQITYLEALESKKPKLEIHRGKYLNSLIKCPICNSSYIKPSEKMSDVNLATYLSVEAYQDKYDTAIVISGDSDLTTPISMVRDLFPYKRIIVAFPPCRSSVSLQRTASGYFTIGERNLARSQFPDSVVSKDGYTLLRPSNWC